MYIVKYMGIAAASMLLFYSSSCKKPAEKPLDREKFLGVYTINENCSIGNQSYDITILASGSNENDVIINGLGAFPFDITATVTGNNFSFNSKQQGFTVSGSGSILIPALTIFYTISGIVEQSCTATGIKH